MMPMKYYQRRQNEKQALEDLSKRTDIANIKSDQSDTIVIKNMEILYSRGRKTIEQQGILWVATKQLTHNHQNIINSITSLQFCKITFFKG